MLFRSSLNLLVALAALIALPFLMRAIGLTVSSATDVVVLAIAVLSLNLLVGYTGLISFGHGVWFGLGAYGAALAQIHLYPEQMFLPALTAIICVAVSQW